MVLMGKKFKKIVAGFKQFITKGNIIDLAVAVVIGGAFNLIVQSLVNDVIMPLFSAVFDVSEFDLLVIHLGKSSIKIGTFIKNIVNFFILSISIYLIVNLVLRRRQFIESLNKEPKKEEKVDENLQTLKEIRDLLKEIQEVKEENDQPE
jgi:large conductance mechanosensitive channel